MAENTTTLPNFENDSGGCFVGYGLNGMAMSVMSTATSIDAIMA